jgi:YD repeat-containing protein
LSPTEYFVSAIDGGAVYNRTGSIEHVLPLVGSGLQPVEVPGELLGSGVTDTLGDITLYTYNHLDQLTEVVDPAGGEVAFDSGHGSVSVQVSDVDGGLAQLRERFVSVEQRDLDEWVPHVTLVHPRTTNRGRHAWAEVQGQRIRGGFDVSTVAVTALDGRRWATVEAFDLAAPRR